MIKFDEVKLVYTSPCFPPAGMQMDMIYSILNKKGDIYTITDGNAEIQVDESVVKMLFSLKNNVHWEDVTFEEEVKAKIK